MKIYVARYDFTNGTHKYRKGDTVDEWTYYMLWSHNRHNLYDSAYDPSQEIEIFEEEPLKIN